MTDVESTQSPSPTLGYSAPAVQSNEFPVNTPRRMTRRARWRSWAELPVQFWWKSALVILVVAAIVGGNEIFAELQLRSLIKRSVQVVATAKEVKGVTESVNRNFGVQRDESIPVKLAATLPDGRAVELSGYLAPAKGWLKVNGPVNVYVDPADPTQWMEVGPLRVWWEVVATPLFMMTPIALLLIAIAWWRRRVVLNVWRNGTLMNGIVIDRSHAPTAPRAHVCRYTLPGERRVFRLLYPMRLGTPQRDQVLPLLVLADRPELALPAQAYAQRAE